MSELDTDLTKIADDVASIKNGAASALADIETSLGRLNGFHASGDLESAKAMATAIQAAHAKLAALLHDSLVS